MEDIAADDDLLSDMLLDSLEFEPKITTHKMNQAYRSPRYKTQDVIDIVRNKVVVECDVGSALDDLLRLDVIKKHVAGKNPRQVQAFQLHARRYLETYLPDSGVEFALTTRYKQATEQSCEAQTSRAGQAEAQARAQARADASACEEAQHQQHGGGKGKSRMSGENGVALGTSKADLCVVATKPFKVGDLVVLCKGGVKDLTRSEDEALREEAAAGREWQKKQEYHGVLGQGRDFSVIRSARKGCSQLLLGPARFVNHDCNPNCEFHRLGQAQMVFKCLRNIGLNEEITTYYGDNYFEWGNSECMCKTCETHGKGAFLLPDSIKMEEGLSTPSLSEAEADKQRRTSQRKIPNRSPPLQIPNATPTVAVIERNGKRVEKVFHHQVSQREFDSQSTSHRGPKCTCLTCGSFFWAPETWWAPDECRRCERHYRIFKADWPGRLPTEGGWSTRAKMKRTEMERKEVEAKARKHLQAPSPGVSSNNSDADTPVKLSPLRETEAPPSKASYKARKRKRAVLADEGTDEDAIDYSLRTTVPASRRTKVKGRAEEREEKGEQDESDLTSVSEGDADDFAPLVGPRSSPSSAGSNESSESRPSGPKMLGKEAKTETLAMYWGAPTGDKRKRRQSNTGLEAMALATKKERRRSASFRKDHRRTASDIILAGAASQSTVARLQGECQQQQQQPRPESLPDVSSPAVSLASASTVKARLSEDGSFESGQHASRNISPSLSLPNLATKGPERTSVKNLAMAWSAGVNEGGRGSRRRQARQSSSASSLPSSKRKHSLHREDTASSEEERLGLAKQEEGGADADDVEKSTARSTIQGTQSPAPRSASPVVAISTSPVHPASPLAGSLPPSSSLTSRSGIVPGQPIRKNLRWGSGKVSSSRPLVGGTGAGSAMSEGCVSTTTNGDSPLRFHSQASASNGSGEGKRGSETSSPLATKDRLNSPLARAALHGASLQLQGMASDGGSHVTGSNGTPASVSPHKQVQHRGASPMSSMGPPPSSHRSSASPGIQSPRPTPSPLRKGEPDWQGGKSEQPSTERGGEEKEEGLEAREAKEVKEEGRRNGLGPLAPTQEHLTSNMSAVHQHP